MKRNFLTVLLALVATLCLCFGLAACGGGGYGTEGTYYLVENDNYDTQTYFTLKGGKWTDEDGATGDYEIDGEKITFYTDFFGERIELTDGTLKDGILTVRDPGGNTVYAQGGAWKGTGGSQSGNGGGGQSPSAKEYTVTYDANGGAFSNGQNTKSVTVKENEKLSEPEEPSRDKYIFVGWCTDSSLEAEWDFAEDTVTKTTTLYAKWESAIVEHDVTYVLNYEGAQDVVKPTEDGLVTYIPERDDYVFNGWWLSDGQTESGEYMLAQKWDTTQKVTEDGLILVAEWVEKSTVSSQLPAPSVTITADVFSWQEVPGAVSYDVRVYEPNSRVEKSKETVQGTSWTFPSGYEAGYYTVKIRAMGDGETTVNSSYVSKSYGHLILGAISKIDFDISTSVLTWTAVRNATSYVLYVDSVEVETLTFTTYDLSEYEAGEHSVKITAKRDGYQSSTASKTINKLRLKTPNVTITPGEDLVNYTVSWNSVSHADTYIVTIGGKETRFKDEFSYTFDRTAESWGDIETIVVTVAAFDSDADYLRSEPSEEQTVKRAYLLTVTVSDEAAGSVFTERELHFSGDEITLTATTNEGYTFVGWYKGDEEVSTKLSYQVTIGKESVTYEARWEAIVYTLTFIYSSEVGDAQDIPTSYTVKDLPLALPTLIGKNGNKHINVGWTSEDGMKYSNELPMGTTGELALTAIWGVTEGTTHLWQDDNTCSVCGAKRPYTKSADGTKIYFGEYPQTGVKESDLKASLGWEAGTNPTSSNAGKWTDYGYYISGSVQSYMWYIDVEYQGSRYRGVYFTRYRPYDTTYSSAMNYSCQVRNGYRTSTVYWFKYEPIEWRVLEQKDGTALLMANIILDSQQYYRTASGSTRTINGKTVYENNYKESDIRAWLTETFYETAFDEYAQEIIETTTVDNSVSSIFGSSYWTGDTDYMCENTQDKVFLLSYKEATTSSYGLNTTTRQLKSTDYAKSQGVYVYDGTGWWWLRSPSLYRSYDAYNVDYDGYPRYFNSCHDDGVNDTSGGVVPALRIRL